MNRPAIRKILNALGTIATLAAVYYLLATLVGNANRITFVFSAVLPVAIVLFCGTHFIQAGIIKILLDTSVPYRSLVRINSAAQLYKYLPGNIAHFFSRWMHLRQHGVGGRENARLIVYETLLLVGTYTVFGIVFFVTSGWGDALAFWPGRQAILLGGLGCVAVAMWVFIKKKSFFLHVKQLAVIVLYSVSALLFGVILCILNIYMVPELSGIGFARYTLGFAVSFLAGFVVPGSPGGIGIREVVFVEIFRLWGNEQHLLTQLIILFRLVAITSELLMYCLTNVLLKNRL